MTKTQKIQRLGEKVAQFEQHHDDIVEYQRKAMQESAKLRL